MKKLIVILTFLTCSLFGQDNPMFDSLEYFQRNKIKAVHYHLSSWYYSPGWKYMKFSFDKKTNTLNCDTLIYYDPSSANAKDIKSFGKRRFGFKDTVYHGKGFAYSTTIKHQFDKQGRLIKLLNITEYYRPGQPIPYPAGETVKDYTTTTSYFYVDSVSKKLLQTVTESPYYTETENFYYEKYLLSVRTTLKSSKGTNKMDFESTSYDYFPDRKLKRETRRVASDHCPGVAGRTSCLGTIDYKYDTEFLNDSTPIPGIPYVYLITIENKLKNEVHVELTGHDSKNKTSEKIMDIFPRLQPDSIYELVFDPRPDHNSIYPAKKNFYAPFDRKKYTDIEINVYVAQSRDLPFDHAKAETLYNERCSVESLFKKKKEITVSKK